ncbi:MAG: segregation/condensation protein A [Anaerolineales bacterium]|nr:segregation/condensation protein A [Anaerolineales bacterium]
MNPIISSYKDQAYSVATPVFQGPLDLLLHLIERAELDITKLALAEVTDQFLEHLENLTELAVEEVSAFLLIAAKLLQIKSEALLPRPVVREAGEEDPGEALARQLLEYKRYKKVAESLREYESLGLHTFLRLAPQPKVEVTADLSDLTVYDLADIARAVFTSYDDRPELKSVVTPPPVTIRQKIKLISNMLRNKGRATFRSLLPGSRSRLDIVVTFLAMLELIKRHLVTVQRDNIFGEIELEPTENWTEDEDFELEFGE